VIDHEIYSIDSPAVCIADLGVEDVRGQEGLFDQGLYFVEDELPGHFVLGFEAEDKLVTEDLLELVVSVVHDGEVGGVLEQFAFVQREGFVCGADPEFGEEEQLEWVHALHAHDESQVEFLALQQKRFLDVFLSYSVGGFA
jgi:hypothetical protein